MTTDDFKLLTLNFITLLISFSNFESILKIIALSISIIYTLLKVTELSSNLYDKFKNKNK